MSQHKISPFMATVKLVYAMASYAKEVQEMREAQNNYFAQRTSWYLQESKKRESRVDKLTDRILGTVKDKDEQLDLFDD